MDPILECDCGVFAWTITAIWSIVHEQIELSTRTVTNEAELPYEKEKVEDKETPEAHTKWPGGKRGKRKRKGPRRSQRRAYVPRSLDP